MESRLAGIKTSAGFLRLSPEGAQRRSPPKTKSWASRSLAHPRHADQRSGDALYLNIASRDDIELAMTKGQLPERV